MVLRFKAETLRTMATTVTITTIAAMTMATTMKVVTAVTFMMSMTLAAATTRISSVRLKTKNFGRHANAIFTCMWAGKMVQNVGIY